VSQGWVSQLATRYRAEGEAEFEARSRRPKTSPRAIPQATVSLIIELRKDPSRAGPGRRVTDDRPASAPPPPVHHLADGHHPVPSPGLAWSCPSHASGRSRPTSDPKPCSPTSAGKPTAPTTRWSAHRYRDLDVSWMTTPGAPRPSPPGTGRATSASAANSSMEVARLPLAENSRCAAAQVSRGSRHAGSPTGNRAAWQRRDRRYWNSDRQLIGSPACHL
jgi:hypothetical protein